jgi:phosphatidylglycerophosphatase A
MNHLAFNGMTGENLTFFLLHGLATIFYSYLKKYHPSVCDRTPSWMGIAIVQLFNIITTPLFVLPFIRAGFFQGRFLSSSVLLLRKTKMVRADRFEIVWDLWQSGLFHC